MVYVWVLKWDDHLLSLAGDLGVCSVPNFLSLYIYSMKCCADSFSSKKTWKYLNELAFTTLFHSSPILKDFHWNYWYLVTPKFSLTTCNIFFSMHISRCIFFLYIFVIHGSHFCYTNLSFSNGWLICFSNTT